MLEARNIYLPRCHRNVIVALWESLRTSHLEANDEGPVRSTAESFEIDGLAKGSSSLAGRDF